MLLRGTAAARALEAGLGWKDAMPRSHPSPLPPFPHPDPGTMDNAEYLRWMSMAFFPAPPPSARDRHISGALCSVSHFRCRRWPLVAWFLGCGIRQRRSRTGNTQDRQRPGGFAVLSNAPGIPCENQGYRPHNPKRARNYARQDARQKARQVSGPSPPRRGQLPARTWHFRAAASLTTLPGRFSSCGKGDIATISALVQDETAVRQGLAGSDSRECCPTAASLRPQSGPLRR